MEEEEGGKDGECSCSHICERHDKIEEEEEEEEEGKLPKSKGVCVCVHVSLCVWRFPAPPRSPSLHSVRWTSV